MKPTYFILILTCLDLRELTYVTKSAINPKNYSQQPNAKHPCMQSQLLYETISSQINFNYNLSSDYELKCSMKHSNTGINQKHKQNIDLICITEYETDSTTNNYNGNEMTNKTNILFNY